MKKILLLIFLVSASSFSNTYHFYPTFGLNALQKNYYKTIYGKEKDINTLSFITSGELTKNIKDNLEIGIGTSYISQRFLLKPKRLPIYGAINYHVDYEILHWKPYIKFRLGESFALKERQKLKTGVYMGTGIGFEKEQYIVEMLYNAHIHKAKQDSSKSSNASVAFSVGYKFDI